MGIYTIPVKQAVLLAQASPGRAFTAPAATFTGLSTANNGGNLQISSAGVHGLTAASVGRFINISAGTGWTTGLYSILTVDSTTALTLNLAYSAGLGAPTVTVVGTAYNVVQHAIPAGLLGPAGKVQASGILSFTNSTNSKSTALRLGGSVGGSLGSGAIFSVASSGHVASRFLFEVANTAVNAQIFGGASALNTYSYGSSSSANSTSAVDTSVQVNATLSVSIPVADEFIKLESYTITVFPS